jgi:hypothetical protein
MCLYSCLSHAARGGCGGKLLNTKFVVWFSLQLSSETFFILRRTERYINIKSHVCLQITRSYCHILIKHEFFNTMSKNSLISNYIKIGPAAAEFLHADTQRHDEPDNHYSQFWCFSAKAARSPPTYCLTQNVNSIILQFSKCSRVSFYDDSLLRPLSSRTKHSRLAVQHCRNSSVLSLLSAVLALFRCACVYSFLF